MFGSVMLDVAIGLMLVYLILSLLCTALRELVEAWLKHRSTLLHLGIKELLHDPALTKDLYQHPLISSLYLDPYDTACERKALPSYIPARNFALAVMDMAARGRDTADAAAAGVGAATMNVTTIRQNISQLGNTKVQRVLLSAMDTADGDLAKLQAALETWFNASMDRVSGWYKRKSQWILISLGIGLAVVANVDSIRIAVALYKDPSKRQAAVAMAGSVVKEQRTDSTGKPLPPSTTDASRLLAGLDTIDLPLGWNAKHGISDVDAMTVLGWLLTGVALSLGAPFWFDMLSKVMTVRSTMKPGSKTSNDPASRVEPSSHNTTVTVVAPPMGSAPASAPAGNPPPVTAPSPGDDYRPHEWSSGHPQGGVI